MKNSKYMIITSLMAAALLMSGCGGSAKPSAPETKAPETAAESESEAPSETEAGAETEAETETEAVPETEAAADYAEAYAAYLEVLQSRREELEAVSWQNEYTVGSWDGIETKYGKEPVAFVNICGDETPEMIFTSTQTQYSAEISIYTYADGEVKCIFNDPEWDMQVAGGERYAFFQTGDEDTLYAYSSMGDELWTFEYFPLVAGDDGTLVPGDKYVLETQPSEDYEGLIETYKLNDAEITEEEFKAAVDPLIGNMRTLVLCSNIDSQSIYDTSLNAEYLAMNADDAMSFLGGETGGSIPAADVTEDNLFEALADQFSFASGAGGWSTELMINDDGSFTGDYHDSDMGDMGDDYPNGTVYTCEFSGQFGDVKKVNDTTYSMHLQEISVENEVGKEWIEDGVRYVASEPYGLDNADEIQVYLEGTPTADLPEEFLSWIAMPRAWGEDIPEVLPCQGLYNVAGQEGFSSY